MSAVLPVPGHPEIRIPVGKNKLFSSGRALLQTPFGEIPPPNLARRQPRIERPGAGVLGEAIPPNAETRTKEEEESE